jgi:arginyl-tRNA synthetase
MKSIEEIVKEEIYKIVQKEFVLEKPKELSFGHYATPIAFALAKELRKNPMMIASDLADKFNQDIDNSIFSEVSAIKGFLNFKLSNKFFDGLAKDILNDENNFAKEENKNSSILLEFVSANPTGPLHIGHARGAINGDTIARIGTHLGYKIDKEYYVNDAGAQIELLGLSLLLAGQEHILNMQVEYPEKYYRGDYLIELANQAKDRFGEEIFTNNHENIMTLSDFAKPIVLEAIKQEMSDLQISFDKYVSEKELYSSWDSIKEKLEKSGALYTQEDKIWLKSTEYGDEKDRVVVRDNGEPTYLAGDIIYHQDKYDRGYDRYINIWGADHHGYIKRVKSSIEFLGNDSSKLDIILAQMVSLLKDGQPFKMSKRAGTTVLLSEVIEDIGSDALRFIFLTKKSDTHLEFDLEDLKKQDSSNPIFYINYAHARIHQLIDKSSFNIDDIKSVELNNIDTPLANLLYEAVQLNSVLNEAFSKYEMQKITDYLYKLSSAMHKFYNEFKIVGSDDEKEKLKVLSIVALSIKTALSILGIEAKNRM